MRAVERDSLAQFCFLRWLVAACKQWEGFLLIKHLFIWTIWLFLQQAWTGIIKCPPQRNHPVKQTRFYCFRISILFHSPTVVILSWVSLPSSTLRCQKEGKFTMKHFGFCFPSCEPESCNYISSLDLGGQCAFSSFHRLPWSCKVHLHRCPSMQWL